MTAATASSEPRRPGRPGGGGSGGGKVREQILDAAEGKFADQGFAGASLRDIAAQAKVTQALVNYYFGSKHGLFVEAYLRRGRVVAERRLENLAALRARNDTGGGAASVADILRAFLSPGFEMRATPGGRAFLRLQARLHTEPEAFAFEVRRRTYDESVQAYAALLAERLPHLAPATVYWRLAQTVGAYLYLISDAHRLESLSGGLAGGRDGARMLDQLVAFTAQGFLAPDV